MDTSQKVRKRAFPPLPTRLQLVAVYPALFVFDVVIIITTANVTDFYWNIFLIKMNYSVKIEWVTLSTALIYFIPL